jgi:hypothetical protein
MNPAEIVMGHVQAHGSGMIGEPHGEAVRAAHGSAHTLARIVMKSCGYEPLILTSC